MGYQPTLADEMGELQERITSTRGKSITSLQAVYVPADDYTDPAPFTSFTHFDGTTELSRDIASPESCIVDPLASTSTILTPEVVGDRHRNVARRLRSTSTVQRAQDIIAILGLGRTFKEDRVTVDRARKVERFLSQPMFVAEVLLRPCSLVLTTLYLHLKLWYKEILTIFLSRLTWQEERRSGKKSAELESNA